MLKNKLFPFHCLLSPGKFFPFLEKLVFHKNLTKISLFSNPGFSFTLNFFKTPPKTPSFQGKNSHRKLVFDNY